jgi:hypothetical protein
MAYDGRVRRAYCSLRHLRVSMGRSRPVALAAMAMGGRWVCSLVWLFGAAPRLLVSAWGPK